MEEAKPLYISIPCINSAVKQYINILKKGADKDDSDPSVSFSN